MYVELRQPHFVIEVRCVQVYLFICILKLKKYVNDQLLAFYYRLLKFGQTLSPFSRKNYNKTWPLNSVLPIVSRASLRPVLTKSFLP